MRSKTTKVELCHTGRNVVFILLLLLLEGGCGQFFRGPQDLIGLSIAPLNTSIQPGNTQQFSATGTFGNGGTGDVTPTAVWSSSNVAIATVNDLGLATGVTFGTVTISAKSQGYTAKTNLSISSQTVTITSIAVTPATPTIQVGRTQQFVATATYSNSTTSVITNSATWTSSDSTIATVSTVGLATGVTTGNVTITATSGSVSGNTTLTVQ